MSRKVGIIEKPHIVEDFVIGNTRIQIADNFCKNKTKEEIDAILRNIEQIAMNNWIKTTSKKNEEEENKTSERI